MILENCFSSDLLTVKVGMEKMYEDIKTLKTEVKSLKEENRQLEKEKVKMQEGLFSLQDRFDNITVS